MGTNNWGTAVRHHIPTLGIMLLLTFYNFKKAKNNMKKKILYVVNVDKKFFLSHRLNIALKAKSFLNVNLATKFELEEKLFRKKKSLTHQIYLKRGSFGIFSNFITMVDIYH